MISFIKRLHDGEIPEDFENYSFNEKQEINNEDDYEQFNKIFNNPQESSADDANHEDIYFQSDYGRNQSENNQLENLKEIDNKKTKPTTITSPFKKIKEEKNQFLKDKIVKVEIKSNPKEILNKKRGRKNKGIDNQRDSEEEVHSKEKEDNKMKKIRTHLIEFIVKKLNDSLIDKSYKFYKIDKLVIENLKIDLNLKLNQRTLLDIFLNEKINGRYKRFSNKYLVKKLVEEKKEEETLNLLKLKFIEMINIIKNNYLDEFFNTIEQKEIIIGNTNLDEYMKSLKEIFLGYENWFKNKRGRNRESKNI
jgi:hypothetical protein